MSLSVRYDGIMFMPPVDGRRLGNLAAAGRRSRVGVGKAAPLEMQTAVTTRAGKGKGYVAHVKILSTLGTADDGKQGHSRTEEHEPYGKYNAGAAVRMRHLQGQPG